MGDLTNSIFDWECTTKGDIEASSI